ncbi:MAG: hypothetical protein ACK48R_20605 [Planctomyces sp.]
MSEPELPPNQWPPLGLPNGSVRALLTLMVVGVVIQAVVRGQELDIIWTESLMITLAYYYTSRRFVSLPSEIIPRLQQEGVLDADQHPLFLPRHSIRFILMAAFAGLGVWLFRENRLQEPRALSLLLIVASFIVGSLVRSIKGLLFRRPPQTNLPARWGDLKALVILGTVGTAVAFKVLQNVDPLPPEYDRVALAMMLYYFGSR